jgi:hypothetical protein
MTSEFSRSVAATRNNYLIKFIEHEPAKNARELLLKLQRRKTEIENELLKGNGKRTELDKELDCIRQVLIEHGKLFQNN